MKRRCTEKVVNVPEVNLSGLVAMYKDSPSKYLRQCSGARRRLAFSLSNGMSVGEDPAYHTT